MIARPWNHRLICLSALAATLLVTSGSVGPAQAGALDKLDSSLKLVPDNAAFYVNMLHNREQVEAIQKSNAWAKIQALPAVQVGLAAYRTQLATPGSRAAMIQAALENPEVRKIVDLVGAMVSDEVFVYGDDTCTDFVELFQNLNFAQSYDPLLMHAEYRAGKIEGNPGQFQATAVMSALVDNLDLIAVPDVVVGFKLKNTDLAKEQLIKLETIGNILLESNEKTKGRFKKAKVGDSEYLVLNLDGSMLPWDRVPMERMKAVEAHEGDAQKIIDRLKKSKLVIALGIRGNYLLASIGSSLECLEKLGQGKKLGDRAEFKPLDQFGDKRVTSIGYLSEDMNRQINNQAQTVDELKRIAFHLLPLAKLSDSKIQQIRNDINGLAADIKGIIPKVGARVGLDFLCDRGVEEYQYAWGDHGRLDGSKPLGLLQHFGGNPLVGIVARINVTVDDYDHVVKWVKTGYGYFEEFGMANMPEEHREKVKQFLTAAMPLFQRLDKVTREMRMPALADGQLAVVVDAKLTGKHFFASMPETDKPMPMVEPALVRSVSDAKLLKQSLGEYREIFNGLVDAARQIEGSNIPPDFKIPEPTVTESDLGTLYAFTLPKAWGVDQRIVPTIGISKDVAVVAISRDHVERLLKATARRRRSVGEIRSPVGCRSLPRLGRTGDRRDALG